jgi:hypothetical protein
VFAGEPTPDWPEGDWYAGWDSPGEFVSVELHVTVVYIVSSTVTVATVIVMGITVPASATTFKGKLKVSSSAA